MCSGILPAKPYPWMKCNSNSPSSPSRDFVRRGNLSPRSCTTRFQTFTLLLLNACKFFKSRLPRSFNLSISQGSKSLGKKVSTMSATWPKTYTGSCHCGLTKYTIQLTLPPTTVTTKPYPPEVLIRKCK